MISLIEGLFYNFYQLFASYHFWFMKFCLSLKLLVTIWWLWGFWFWCRTTSNCPTPTRNRSPYFAAKCPKWNASCFSAGPLSFSQRRRFWVSRMRPILGYINHKVEKIKVLSTIRQTFFAVLKAKIRKNKDDRLLPLLLETRLEKI